MVYPVGSSRSPLSTLPEIQEKEDDNAELIVQWYASSIQSLQTSHPATEDAAKQTPAVEGGNNERGMVKKFTSWFWGLFGKKGVDSVSSPIQPGVETSEVDAIKGPSSAGLSGAPKLDSPDSMSNEKLLQAIAEVKHALYRQHDTAEFEADMRRSNSHKMDCLILLHLIAKSLEQRKLKEEACLGVHTRILELQKENKDLNHKYYELLADIIAIAKINTNLNWIRIGSTVGIVGGLAVGFATGGQGFIFAVVLPALNITQGISSGIGGVLRYKNDLRKGEAGQIETRERSNRVKIGDKVNNTFSGINEDISALLRTIREILEVYGKEARLNARS